VQAQLATEILSGPTALENGGATPAAADRQLVRSPPAPTQAAPEQQSRDGRPTLEDLLSRAQACGIDVQRYTAYADLRWGTGWKLNPHGRARAWDELERYRNDPAGYLDKVESELQAEPAGRTA